jgi:signal transduction histidine kinase
MQERIATLLKGRAVLLGAISHDLKTYITRLKLRAGMIADQDQQARAERDLDDMTNLIEQALARARGTAVAERMSTVQSSPGTQFIGVARVFACSHSLISARSNQRPLCRPGQLLRLSASGYWAKTEVPKIVFDG